jgi:hypothetical protein
LLISLNAVLPANLSTGENASQSRPDGKNICLVNATEQTELYKCSIIQERFSSLDGWPSAGCNAANLSTKHTQNGLMARAVAW